MSGGIGAEGRRASLIIVGTALIWMLIQSVGGRQGWGPELMLVFDALALAGFIWGAVAVTRAWRGKE
ncbi:DUF5337 family protein [Falsirhodobacter halotolerans]|uniref:DUF5337 family protein n=1 Tax=Falsirhodobacter halotolerans TaxID=1146892 RepID=UPI001FD49FA9|nr:DUF5337 family protein [Falsirhodobacter halotolerans]MCJ8140198.1 DUF5337 domain-containing protein [Falsirhodobacter halotolerans]